MIRLAFTTALLAASALTAQFPTVGVFYTLTNDTTKNQVQIGAGLFGRVFPITRISTGGKGTAAGLGSQGALAANRNYLVAVNPGSDDITLFRRRGSVFLSRSDIEKTGGTRPTSVAIRGDLVFALNAGSDNVTGFRISKGSLKPIGRFALSGSGVAAAQVGFDPSGRYVIVTERATNQILVFPVRRNGSLGTPSINDSAAATPFGFLFRKDGTLVVSEAVGGQAGASVASSYQIRPNGRLRAISGAVATNQSAACWIAIPRNGRFAYTTNTASGTITGFGLQRSGQLTRLDSSGATGRLRDGARPIDFEFNRAGRLLFVLDSGNDEVVSFFRDRAGRLHRLGGSLSLPDGAAGLIAQ